MRMPAMQRAMSHFERANGVFESELGAKALPGNTIDDAPEAVGDARAYGAQVVTKAMPNGEREHCHARRPPPFDRTLQLSRALSANLRRAHWAFPHRAAAQQPSVVGALIRRRVLALHSTPHDFHVVTDAPPATTRNALHAARSQTVPELIRLASTLFAIRSCTLRRVTKLVIFPRRRRNDRRPRRNGASGGTSRRLRRRTPMGANQTGQLGC